MGKRALFFLTMLGLSGCSGPVETRILSSGQGINASISIADTASTAAPLHAKARELAIAGLQKRIGISPGAASHQLVVTLSERPAAIALRAGTQQAARVIAAAKRRKPLQNCEDREFRLSVVMTRIADGTESYRGEASEYHCKASIEESLPHLVDAALSDLRAPQGSHLLTRKGRD